MNTKTIICALALLTGITANASIPAYQVYDLKFNAKTTVAKGITTISDSCCGAGEEYCYREKSTVVIKGVLAGCYCGSILANDSCENAILWLWDETRGIAISNVTTQTGWRIQVIGKKQTVVENYMRFTATYGEDDMYTIDVTMCGFGSNKIDSKDHNYNYVPSISGYFAGWITAPYYYKAGKYNCCGVTEAPIFTMSQSLAMCACSDYEGDTNPELTPFGGTYTVKYNSSKSKKVAKGEFTQKAFGLPSYVSLTDYVATNIGE